jgi:hypothetical protein
MGDPTASGTILDQLGLADLTPLGAAFAVQEGSRTFERGRETGDPLTMAMGGVEAGLGILEATPLAGLIFKGIGDAARGIDPNTLFTVFGPPPGGRSPLEPHSNPLMRAEEEVAGIRAYHGSPYTFERFDVSKIGTGEGAQAYGHGLYFAESEPTARFYRESLSRPYFATAEGKDIAKIYGEDVASIFESTGGDPDEMLEILNRFRRLVKINLDDYGVSDISELPKSEYYGDLPSTIIDFSDRADRLESMLNAGDVKLVNPGRMYEVNIAARPEDFIDYDVPLSQQSDLVKAQFGYTPKPTAEEELAAFEIAKRESPNNIGDHPAMQEIYRRESASNAAERRFQRQVQGVGIDEAARIALSEAGIPGVRYLDAGSRYTLDNLPDNVITREARQFLDQAGGDPDKALSLFNQSNPVERWAQSERNEVAKVIASAKKTATRNYVVFDDRLISIVRMYGIGGAAALLGVTAADVEQALAENLPPSEWESLVVGPQ